MFSQTTLIPTIRMIVTCEYPLDCLQLTGSAFVLDVKRVAVEPLEKFAYGSLTTELVHYDDSFTCVVLPPVVTAVLDVE